MRILVLLLTSGLAGAPALPVPPTAPPVGSDPAPAVEELVYRVLERSPSLDALREKLAAAREMVAPAGALPDPMVELMLQDPSFPQYTVGTMEMSMIGPEVRQALPFPGKRDARRAVARAEVDIRLDELDQMRRQLVAQVRQIYARIYALDQERATLSAARQLLDMLAATAATRYGVGEAEQEAVIKAQLEVSRLEERSDDLDAERATLVSALNRLLDQPGGAPLGEVKLLPPQTVPAEPWEDAVLASSAEIAVRRATVVAGQRRVDETRLDLKPDLTTGVAVGLRGGLDPVVTLRFGVELPLWRNVRQRPMIRAAEHDLETARAELRDAEAAARAEAARLRAEWDRAEKQIVRYRQAIIPQSSAAIDSARSSYLAGRGDFSTVVEDFRLWLDARSELARREADRFATWADLDALIHGQDADPGPQGQRPATATDQPSSAAPATEASPETDKPAQRRAGLHPFKG
ncbi:MAG TPA: TolC family protein [Thermoanaerobaculaceae bacterium]|nr:TolC family protein [Thermoanaerobaculaceae bacterium]HPS78673.1 TolC family protein [Thermoanaerobaculaceae bacterium]